MPGSSSPLSPCCCLPSPLPLWACPGPYIWLSTRPALGPQLTPSHPPVLDNFIVSETTKGLQLRPSFLCLNYCRGETGKTSSFSNAWNHTWFLQGWRRRTQRVRGQLPVHLHGKWITRGTINERSHNVFWMYSVFQYMVHKREVNSSIGVRIYI